MDGMSAPRKKPDLHETVHNPTKIFSFKLVLPNGSSQQYVGTQAPYASSSGAGTPRYRGTWTNSYVMGPGSLSLTTDHTSGFASTGIESS
jgi:iron complex outermembrane receptor protein